MDGSLFIIDALNFLFRAFHALPPLTTKQGTPTGAVYGLAQMLLRIEREQKPTHMCVVFDAPGRTFRDDIFTGYKAHRPPMPPELFAQVELAHQLIDALALPVLTVPGVEADDVIATLARQAQPTGLRVVICSSDKDLMQLCCDGISILDTMYNRMIGPAQVKEKFGVPPELVGDVLALMGDSIDNVPGVAGVGPKTAADLIVRFGSLEGLLTRIDEVKTKKGQAIAAAREDVLLSRRLVALREDVELPRPLTDLQRVPRDFSRLRVFARDLEFLRLLPQIDALEASLGGEAANTTPSAPDAASSEGAPEAAVAAPPEPVPPPPAPALVLDHAAAQALATAIEHAGACALAVLADGPDPARAGIVGLAVVLPSGERHYLPLGIRQLGAPAALSEVDGLALLHDVLVSPRIAKHVHEAKFLDVLLRARGAELAGVASDSMLAAYVLDASRTRHDLALAATSQGLPGPAPRVTWLGSGRTARAPGDIPFAEAGAYLAAEAASTLALAPVQEAKLLALGLDSLYRTIELPTANVLARIESRGIRIDGDHLRQLGQEVARSIQAIETEIHQLAGGVFNIGSSKQLAEILFGKLALPIIRRTKTGPSTDADVLEELAVLHPAPAKIIEWRMLTKLKGTYIEALPALINTRTGRLHTTFNQAVAATGRLSSSDPNLQNIPIRSEIGRRIREGFIADPGYRIVSADYSQIELRILAHFSEDPAFLEAFNAGDDIHRRTAAQVFDVPLETVSSEQRRIAKAINFGLVFGQSDFGLAQVLRIPRAQARLYIDNYFQRYAGVRAYMERAIADARHSGEVTTLLGRRRPLPEIRSSRAQERNHAERIARNSPIQGSAADLLKLAMIRVDAGMSEARWREARLLLTVHDELVFEVPTDDVVPFSSWVKSEMEAVYTLRVPLVVDVGAGPTWGAAH